MSDSTSDTTRPNPSSFIHKRLSPKKGITGTLFMSLIFGFLGGLSAISFYFSQNPNLNIPGVSQGNTVIQVKEDSDVIDAVDKILPSVVSIVSIKNVRGVFGNVSQEKGGGTGFVLTSNGLIMTNKHVVSDTSAEYHVFTNDGSSYVAKVQSIDPIMDLAIIKIDAKNLKAVDFGKSDDLEIGQRVIAVGNALGEFQNTVTTGIISAVERSIQAGDSLGNNAERLDGLLQTDAAINPGNSGGPLLNLAGQVVGINTAVASLSQSQGIGFAIPIDFARTALKSYEKYQEIVRPYLGIRFVQLTPEIASANDLKVERGALVYSSDGQVSVISGSPADKAGISEGDIITKLGGENITATRGLIQLLQRHMPGDEVDISYVRDGKTVTLKIKLGELRY
jgi:serine protease Do